MASIPGSIPVTGFIAPTDTTDTFPVTDAIYGIDGFRSVSGSTSRDSITLERRREGMLVYTQDDGNVWQLLPEPWAQDATDWKLYISSASTGVLSGGTAYITGITSTIVSAITGNYIPLSGTNGDFITGDLEFDDDILLSWNGGADTLTYDSAATNIAFNSTTGVDFETGAIFSAGTDLYDIFGSGSNTTASNGLTKTGDNITLGGLLTGNTTITGGNNSMTFDNLSSYFVSADTTHIGTFSDPSINGDGFDVKGYYHIQPSNVEHLMYISPDDDSIILKTDNSSESTEARLEIGRFSMILSAIGTSGETNQITIGNEGVSIANTPGGAFYLPESTDPDNDVFAPQNGALKYDATDDEIRAYIGGAWTSLATSNSTVTASNGLTKTGSNITLGGALTGDTYIDNSGFIFASESFSADTMTAKTISANSGAGRLDLRAFGTNNTVLLSTDGDTGSGLNDASLYMSPTQGGLYFTDASITDYNYLELTDSYGVLWAQRNGKSNSVTVQAGTGTGSTNNAVQLNSVTGDITMSAGTGDIYIFNSVATDNSLTTLLARDPSDGKLREVTISSLTGATSGTTTASNGLTKSGSNIALGGVLTGDTYIDNSGFILRSNEYSATTMSAQTVVVGSDLNLPVYANSFSSTTHGDVWVSTGATGTFINAYVGGVVKSVELT